MDRPTFLLEDTPQARGSLAVLHPQLRAEIEQSHAAAHTPEGQERERHLNEILYIYAKEEAERQLHPQHEHSIPSGSTTPRANGAASHNDTTGSQMPSRDNMVTQPTRNPTRLPRNFGPAGGPSTPSASTTHAPLQTMPPVLRREATQTSVGSAGLLFDSSALSTSTSTTHSSLQESPPIFPRRDDIQTALQEPEGSRSTTRSHLCSPKRNSTEASSPAPLGGAQRSGSWPNSMLWRKGPAGSSSASATLSASSPAFTPSRATRAATLTPSPMQREGSGSSSSTTSLANINPFTPTSSPVTSEAAQSSPRRSRFFMASTSSSNTAPGPSNAEASHGSSNVTPGSSNTEVSTTSRPPRRTEVRQLHEIK
jgi:hypothetical protein